MAKVAKIAPRKSIGGSAQTGKFLGRTAEGLLIPRPDFKPKSFTVRQLQEAIRAVRSEREAAAKAG